jgi:dehydrogenase/reductase SDR family member 12
MRGPWNLLLDSSIYFSFDRSGYRRHARSFESSDLEVDLTSQRCLVTGANSGIGYATAAALAARGAEVWLVCRSPERGARALESLRQETGSERLHLTVLDLSDLDAIRSWADTFAPERIDVLVHNAGLLPLERRLSPSGHEITFATHVLGPFLLTQLLRERLAAAPEARVVWVSSGGMYAKKLSFEDLDWSQRSYDGVAAYAQTKRMQVVLSELFAERWGQPVRFHAMHPGWVETPGVQNSLPKFWEFTKGRLRTPAEGADTVVWLAAAERPGRDTGQFWFDREQRSTTLLPGTGAAQAEREALWELCRQATALQGASA